MATAAVPTYMAGCGNSEGDRKCGSFDSGAVGSGTVAHARDLSSIPRTPRNLALPDRHQRVGRHVSQNSDGHTLQPYGAGALQGQWNRSSGKKEAAPDARTRLTRKQACHHNAGLGVSFRRDGSCGAEWSQKGGERKPKLLKHQTGTNKCQTRNKKQDNQTSRHTCHATVYLLSRSL